ncbi:hypothetical protein OG978_36795 [Streptomyces sp. NBC_01591]|uniref:hypothetical protein n=1 Tax=Streptomyces sp. NBC_01591 TaxID=2975888 RepID=UPI002DDC0DBF|nr:hypothetical protein [Streptomyces sp. NBC_01591]WSD72476.1 hypothetical protein OG978_36795 [Streptomyces sp. NBC_01591]
MRPGRPSTFGALRRSRFPQLTPLSWAVTLVTALLSAFLPPLTSTSSARDRPSAVGQVNPFIGTTGQSDTEYGGVIPSTAPPFGMTRWSPMTRDNYVSRTPYHYNDSEITGFIGTHQPTIWMGDSGYVVGMPGVSSVKTAAADRGLPFRPTRPAHGYCSAGTVAPGPGG